MTAEHSPRFTTTDHSHTGRLVTSFYREGQQTFQQTISIQMSAKSHRITAIQVYVPTSNHDNEEVEHLYQQLDNITAKTPKKDRLVAPGDWNPKVGPDAYQHRAETVGRFGTRETNNRGCTVLEFAKNHRLALANASSPQVV